MQARASLGQTGVTTAALPDALRRLENFFLVVKLRLLANKTESLLGAGTLVALPSSPRRKRSARAVRGFSRGWTQEQRRRKSTSPFLCLLSPILRRSPSPIRRRSQPPIRRSCRCVAGLGGLFTCILVVVCSLRALIGRFTCIRRPLLLRRSRCPCRCDLYTNYACSIF